LLRFSAGKRRDRNEARNGGDLLAGIVFNCLSDRVDRRFKPKRPRYLLKIHYVPLIHFNSPQSRCGEWSRAVGTERKFLGQRDWGNSPVESIQITMILNHNDSKSQFEMILLCKRSKEMKETP
jgi:hypothetical protein